MLATLDWWVIGNYLLLLLALGGVLSRHQLSGADYFLAGRSELPFNIALSVLATQCSTNSSLGAPAVVAFAAGGGLVWLQYELAAPLVMIFTMIFVIPMFQRLQLVSVVASDTVWTPAFFVGQGFERSWASGCGVWILTGAGCVWRAVTVRRSREGKGLERRL